jgi:hypothetical protein
MKPGKSQIKPSIYPRLNLELRTLNFLTSNKEFNFLFTLDHQRTTSKIHGEIY